MRTPARPPAFRFGKRRLTVSLFVAHAGAETAIAIILASDPPAPGRRDPQPFPGPALPTKNDISPARWLARAGRD